MSEYRNYRQISKGAWGTNDDATSLEQINAGSLQRIADAVETVSGNYNALIAGKKSAEESRDYWRIYSERMERKNRALRGVITKLKNKGARK